MVVNQKSSRLAKVKSGVPQGSVLGPFLFLVYMNSMTESIGNAGMFGVAVFADDRKVYQVQQNDRKVIGRFSQGH